MASISAIGSKGHHKFTLNVTEKSVDIAKNTSTISWSFVLSSLGGGYDWYYDSTVPVTYSITINGEIYTGSIMNYDGSSTVTVRSGSMKVEHYANGRRNIQFSFNVSSIGYYYLPGSANSSGSLELTYNARATLPIIYTSNIDMGKNITITLPRTSEAFAHVLRYRFGDTTGFISGYAEDEVDWVIPLDLANLIPHATSGMLYIHCDTYSGETRIGTTGTSLRINVPLNIIPTVTIATIDPTGFANKYGAFVQGFSKFKTDVSASGVYGSVIKSYKVTADGKAYTTNSVTTDVISGSGELTITATVTDSRNRASAVSGKVNVLPYVNPKITSISVYRCNEEGEKANSGQYLAVVFSAEITALNNANSAVYSIQYKKNTDTDYATEQITDYTGQYTVKNGVFIFAADTSSSYDIILTASDDFSSVERITTGSSIKKLWSILKKGFGFAFGKIAELPNTLEVALKAVFYEDVHIKGALTYDIPISHNDVDAMLTSGKFYLGINAKNRPINENGWLEVQNYGEGNYCYHKFVTYTGKKYERWRTDGVWGEWISDLTIVAEEWFWISGVTGVANFCRCGNVTTLTLHTILTSAPQANASGVFLGIPEGFEPNPAQITGETTTTILWGRGSHISSNVGSLSIYDTNRIRIFYDFTNTGMAANWTLGATMTWLN